MVHRRAVLVVLAALLGACVPISRDFAPAHEAPGRTAASSPVSFSVDSVGGAPLPTYALGDALFVEGREGEGYTVRLTNHTADRYEAVVTVDGRDVVSGQLGRPAKHRGYVLEPYETLVIDGYRRSLDEVASFYFASRYDSYTARRGTAEHAGVIGVALFEEKQSRSRRQPLTRNSYEARPEPFPAARTSRTRSGADDAVAAQSEEHLGTGYGASEYSPVHETDFKRRRKARPDVLLTAYYDSREGLQARGLLPRRVDVVDPYEPAYEPRDAVDSRFVPSPWQRDR